MEQIQSHGTPPVDGFVRVAQIVGDRKRGIPAILPISRSAWWAGVKRRIYPQPFHHGRVTLWKISDIRALIETIAAAP